MKTLKLIFLFATVVATFSSCTSNDDDKIESVSGDRYETTYGTETYTFEGIEYSDIYETIAELKEGDMYFKVEFKTDGTFWGYEENEEGDFEWMEFGSWIQKDSRITLYIDNSEGEVEELNMVVDGNKIILKAIEGDYSLEWHFSKV